jgi:hypothetical protein
MTASAPAALPSAQGADSVISSGFSSGGVDYPALWRQVDAEVVRVVVVDLTKRATVAGRAMGELAEGASRFGSEMTLERLFPGAAALIERWSTEADWPNNELTSHSLSPRQWVYFWRIDPKVGLLALVHHRYGRGATSASDAALIRVLSEHWLAPELQAMGVGRASTAPWNRVERRARAAAPAALWGALAALAVAIACGLWLLLGAAAAPAQSETPVAREAQRLAKLSDDTLVRSLSRAMAGKDYGEVQEALAEHLALEHYDAAAVLNERKQVVAHAGFERPPTVGQPLPAALGADTRRFPLTWAGNSLGELVAAQKPARLDGANAAQATAMRVRGAGVALVAFGLVCGALLWRHIRQRYR